MFSFLIKPESFDGHEFDESLIEWMDTRDLEMQLIEFKNSALWTTKFVELHKELETIAVNKQGSCIFTCWTSLPEKFCCLKRVALALLTVFGSTYLCKHIFSHMNNVLCPSHNRLSFDHSEASVQLMVMQYTSKIMELSIGKQDQGSH